MPRVTRSTRANPAVETERSALGELPVDGGDVNSSIEAVEPKKRVTRNQGTKGSGKENVPTAKGKGKKGTTTAAKTTRGAGRKKVGVDEVKEIEEVKEVALESEVEKEGDEEKKDDGEEDTEAKEQLESLEEAMRDGDGDGEETEVDEPPIAQVTPEKTAAIEPKTVAKTPKFDPDAHADHLDSVGNESFELICSPKKKRSTLVFASNESKKKAVVKAAAPVVPVKKRASVAPAPVVRAAKAKAPTQTGTAKPAAAKPAANSSAIRTRHITSAAPQSPKLEKRRTTHVSKPVEAKRVVSGASTASTTATTRTRSVGLTFPPPPPPVRSSKPPTVPTFELPGEAFSRKAAAAREERRKRIEEEEKKRKQYKAKPAPKSVFKQHMTQHQQRFGAMNSSSTDSASSPATHTSTPESKGDSMRDTPDIGVLKEAASAITATSSNEVADACSTTSVATSNEQKQETESIKSSSTATASDSFVKATNAPLLKVTDKKPATVALSPDQALRQRIKHRQQMEKDTAQRTGLDKKTQALAVLKTRKEAAEKGREAVKMWAEMQKQKQAAMAAAAAKKPGDSATSAIVV